MADVKKETVKAAVPAATDYGFSEKKGLFADILGRSNSQIKKDRAVVILESSEIKYRRETEDLVQKIRRLRQTRDSKLDLSPANTQTLKFEEFDEQAFVAEDIQSSLEIRQAELKLEIMYERYETLFGESLNIKK